MKNDITNKQLFNYLLTAQDILKLGITEVPMLIAPIFEKIGIGTMTGASDTGKSYFLLDLAVSICSDNTEVLGLPVTKEHSSVIFVSTEDPMEKISVRLHGLLKVKEINANKLRFIFETDNLIKRLREQLMYQAADLIVIDTFGDNYRGNLNDSIGVRQFLEPYKILANEFKCLILFNHHIGKGKEHNLSPSRNDMLGSQGIESASRSVYVLRKNQDETRVLTVVKGNNISDQYKNKGIILNFNTHNGFTPNGRSVDYSNKKKEVSPEIIQRVLKLYPEQKSLQKVADILRLDNIRIDKNKVARILKEHGESGKGPKETENGEGELEAA